MAVIIEIMNRKEARNETFRNNAPTTAVISITDIGSNPNQFNKAEWLKAVLKLQFADVEFDHPIWGKAITDDDAIKIKNFVFRVKDKVERIIVHCEAGISRSAGVGAAIMKFLNGDDMPIFSNGRFTPNKTCFRKVLNALVGSVDEEDLGVKDSINLSAFKQVNELD